MRKVNGLRVSVWSAGRTTAFCRRGADNPAPASPTRGRCTIQGRREPNSCVPPVGNDPFRSHSTGCRFATRGAIEIELPSLAHVVLALIGWVDYARVVRGQVLKLRELEYVQAARAVGAPVAIILLRHITPGELPALTVQATLGMAGAIIAEASLGILGLGVQPPTPSWGTMLDAGRSHLFDAPHLTLFPGLAIALLVVRFNLVGDGLRDRLDPRG